MGSIIEEYLAARKVFEMITESITGGRDISGLWALITPIPLSALLLLCGFLAI